MDNGNGEMSDETRRKFEIQKRAYKELAALKKELEKLKEKIQETDKNPLASPENLPAEEIDYFGGIFICQPRRKKE